MFTQRGLMTGIANRMDIFKCNVIIYWGLNLMGNGIAMIHV
jgi:hypothetical protein